MGDQSSNLPATQASAPPSLSFPRATFAKLSPRPFLQAHLSPSDKNARSSRPSGRHPDETRPPTAHLGSLTHANGSAVIRIGDTAVVCGVRAEILQTRDVPGFRQRIYDLGQRESHAEVRELGLLVPNIELATGCSPQNLPGSPPSTLAQSLSMRILSLLHSSRIIDPGSLQIWHRPPEPQNMDDSSEEDQEADFEPMVKGFWTLYMDMLFISLDGNAYDAAWASVVAALSSTKLPRAQWSPDTDSISCSILHKMKPVKLLGFPVSCTFAIFNSTAPGQLIGKNVQEEKKAWVLADPDMFEEGLCDEVVTIVVDYRSHDWSQRTNAGSPRILRIEKRGGGFMGKDEIRDLLDSAGRRWLEWRGLLKQDDQ